MSNYNDNTVPYGTRVVAFKRPNAGGTSGVVSTWAALANAAAVVLENTSVSRPLKQVKLYDETGKPSKSFGVDDWVDGSATAQLAKDPKTTTTVALQPGDAFTETFDLSIGAESFVITGADAPEDQHMYKKQSIRFSKLYNVTP